jgi:hypothetical protein
MNKIKKYYVVILATTIFLLVKLLPTGSSEEEIVLVGLAGITIVSCFFLGAWWVWSRYTLSKHGVLAPAIVNSMSERKGWLNVEYHFVIPDEKRIIYGKDSWPKWSLGTLAPGQSINVQYYKNNPKLNRIDRSGFKPRWVWL